MGLGQTVRVKVLLLADVSWLCRPVAAKENTTIIVGSIPRK
jgi:hypothetical protein